MTLQLAVKITGDASSLKQAALDGAAATKGIGTAAQAAAGDIARLTAATVSAEKAQHDQTAAMLAGIAASANARAAQTLALGTGRAAAAANPNAAQAAASGFRPDQWKNLSFQANDVFTSLASGAPVMQMLAQQGGQVAQVLGDAPGGIAGGLKIVGSRALELLTPVRLMAGGFIGAGAAVAYLGVTWARTQDEIRTGLMGIGAQSRATGADINNIAERAASGGKVSRGNARGIASAVASTGKVDVSNIPDIVDLAPGYAKLFGKDLTETGTDLARIFADPVKGAAELDARMGGLDAATQTYIRTLMDQNNRQEAVRVMVRTFGTDIQAAAESTGVWAKAWGLVTTAADMAAGAVAKPFREGTTKDQLSAARAALAEAQRGASRGLVIGRGPDLQQERNRQLIASRQAEVDRLAKKDATETAAPGKLASEDLGKQAEAAVRALQPEIDQLETLNSRILLLQKTQGDANAMAGLSAGSRKQVTDALDAARGGVETFMAAQDKARASEALTIRSIEARTDAERAAIAAERERLNLSGQNVGANDQRRAIEAARQAVLAQSTRESQDRLRGATASNAAAGLLSYPRQIADLDAKYRDVLFADPTNANNLRAKALDRQAIDKEAIGNPMRDANRSIAEQAAGLKIQQDAFGLSTEAASRMAAAQQLVNQYTAAGIPISADLKRGIDAHAASAGKLAAAQEDLTRKQREVIGGLDDIRSGSRSALTGIFSDVSQGKSPLAGITSSLNGVASKMFERSVATPLVNSTFGLDGKAGGGLFGDAISGMFGKAQGLSTADITAGVVNLSGPMAGIPGLAGTAANGNVPSAVSAASGLTGAGSAQAASGIVAGLSGSRAEVADYVRQAAVARGIDPNVALRVVNQESGFNTAAQNLTGKEQSYGVMQLNTMGGLGADALKAGVDVRNPDAWRSQVDYGMDVVKRDGWRQWYGARDIGVSRWEGVGQGAGTAPSATAVAAPLASLDTSLQSVGSTATTASQGVTQLGNALGSNGGGLTGILANLFGGGASASTATAVTAATGGHIRGPGTSTSDSIHARLSDGEFVVNAAATRQNLGLLHAINENRMPAFAEGGPVGAMRPGSGGSSGGSDGGGLSVTINNGHPSADVSAREQPDGRGGRQLVVQVDEMTAAAVGRPGSKTAAALARQRVVRR